MSVFAGPGDLPGADEFLVLEALRQPQSATPDDVLRGQPPKAHPQLMDWRIWRGDDANSQVARIATTGGGCRGMKASDVSRYDTGSRFGASSVSGMLRSARNSGG